MPLWAGFSEETTGLVLSSFFAGYACTQVIGGWAAAKFGGKPVLLFAVFVWSVATALTPAAAGVSVPMLVAVRVLMGVGAWAAAAAAMAAAAAAAVAAVAAAAALPPLGSTSSAQAHGRPSRCRSPTVPADLQGAGGGRWWQGGSVAAGDAPPH